MAPRHWHLADAVVQTTRDEQYLRVEAPAFHQLQAKDRLRGGAAKRLEAALRIRVRQPHHKPRDTVEAAPETAAIKGLLNRRPRAIEPTRTNRYVRPIGDRGEQQLSLLNGCGEV